MVRVLIDKQQFQETIPTIVLIAIIALCGISVIISLRYFHFTHVLLVTTLIAFIGIFFSRLPYFEYIVMLGITTVAIYFAAPTWQYIIVLSGVWVGYFWGNWVARILDRPNVDRQISEAQSNDSGVE